MDMIKIFEELVELPEKERKNKIKEIKEEFISEFEVEKQEKIRQRMWVADQKYSKYKNDQARMNAILHDIYDNIEKLNEYLNGLNQKR